MGSCDHCWQLPCTCGQYYKGLSAHQIKKMIDTLKVVLADKLVAEMDETQYWDRGGLR